MGKLLRLFDNVKKKLSVIYDRQQTSRQHFVRHPVNLTFSDVNGFFTKCFGVPIIFGQTKMNFLLEFDSGIGKLVNMFIIT